MLSRIQSRSTLLLPLVTLLSLPHLKRAHGMAVANFGAIPTQTGIRLRWMRGFMPVSTIATPSSKAFAWDTKSQNKSATSSSFCCQEGQNPSFLTIETLWSSLEGFGRLESTWLDQGDYLKMWWGRRRWRARAGATIGHHRRSVERCLWRRLRKKSAPVLGSATASFCCRNSTGTLEHETQDSKESHHGNCGKQVGE